MATTMTTREAIRTTDDPARLRRWLRSVRRQKWDGIEEILAESQAVHGDPGRGCWLCDACHGAVVDPAISCCDDGSLAQLYGDDVCLCARCVGTARGEVHLARAKSQRRYHEHQYVRDITPDRRERAQMHETIDRIYA